MNRHPIESSGGIWARAWLYGLAVLTLAFLMLPTLIVVPMSFSESRYLEFPPRAWSLRWYNFFLHHSPEWQEATFVSLKAAVLTTLLATPLGTAAAYGIHRLRGRIAGTIQVLLILPMMVPVILIAIGAFFVYARLGLNNTMLGLVLAHSLLAIPFVVITVLSGLKNFEMEQELVACSLGASRTKAFLTITLPQIRFTVIAGALFAFITSLDEVVMALFISGGSNATIQRRVFNALRDEIDPTIAVISTGLITVSILIVISTQFLVGLGGGRSEKEKPAP